MNVVIKIAQLADLGEMRRKFIDTLDNQFTYDKCHLYGWADTYLIREDEKIAGYGAVWGKENREDRDSIFEFYLEPEFRTHAHEFFGQLIQVSRVSWIECQSNDPFLSEMFFEFATEIYAEAILFEDGFQSNMSIEGARLSANESASGRFDKQYVLMLNGEIVGKGGLMLNYNFPYADIYYGIEEQHRRKGLGSFFVQELKKEAYRIGMVPAARTNINNMISKRTMLKAGLKPCGWRLCGKIRK